MNYSYEDKVSFAVKNISKDINGPEKFLSGAVAFQNKAYRVDWANKKFAYACDVLARIGYCHNKCEQCPLHGAHEKAIEEIKDDVRIIKIHPVQPTFTKEELIVIHAVMEAVEHTSLLKSHEAVLQSIANKTKRYSQN